MACSQEKEQSKESSITSTPDNNIVIDTSDQCDAREKGQLESQFVLDRYGDRLDWSELEVHLSMKERFRIIESVSEFFDFLDETERFEQIRGSLHYIHINGDSLVDVIYHGHSSGEMSWIVAFCQRADGTFEKWFHTYQDPISMTVERNLLKKLVIIDWACCADIENTLFEFDVADSLTMIGAYYFNDLTDMNGKVIEPIKFKVPVAEYNLRCTPAKDDSSEISMMDEVKGNVYGVLGGGQTGTAFKSSTDSTGRVWWLIETEPLDSLVKQYMGVGNSFKTSYIGWVSSRFLERI